MYTQQNGFADFLKFYWRIIFLLSLFLSKNFEFVTLKVPLKYNYSLISLPPLQVLTSISQMVPETKQNINSKHIKMLIENFLSSISRDKNILSLKLLSVTENEVKIQSSFFISGLILLIMNLSNSRYVNSNLNLHF